MDTNFSNCILAIITTDSSKVAQGGCPVFYALNQEEQEQISLLLARILGGLVHDLENGVYIIVRH
ncbi:MAG TPA: hypothetical protein DER33_02500 [Syntrophomonas sp.]|jgi:L-alanine-DL-glutamate epimerase-like enolase superfamily enzyme|nr:hypothetical protein [Syntrophomonas sp.]HCF70455.1 hypothetical protein [Syntrophomonas sp.]